MSFAHFHGCVKEDKIILRRLIREEVNTRAKLSDIETEKQETQNRIDSTKLQLQMLCEKAFADLDRNKSGKISVWEFLDWFFESNDYPDNEGKLKLLRNKAMSIFYRIDTNSDELISLEEAVSYNNSLVENL